MWKIIQNLRENKEKEFLSLMVPRNNININDYKSVLTNLSNEACRNIALYGSYGAGKSSVIESLKKKYRNGSTFLHIYLSYCEPTNNTGSGKDIHEATMEGEILNQLIHQIDPKKIPLTSFKVKREIDHIDARAIVFLAMAFLVSFLHTTKFTIWQAYIANAASSCIEPIKSILTFTASPEAPLVSGTVCLIVLSIIIYKFITSAQYRKIVWKICLQGNEIELTSNNDESYFDRYLDDILYLFEKVDKENIVFEYSGRNISKLFFEKLKRINIQVNGRRNTPIRFWHLLTPGVLTPEEARSVFDYTFPVIEHDICNWFFKHLEDIGMFECFSAGEAGYLHYIASCINDIDILKTICNDFKLYYNLSNQEEWPHDKLLSMLIYKNRFPLDYESLKGGNGFLYALFSRKHEITQNELSSIDVQIASLETKLKAAKDEPLKSFEEIDIVYSTKIAQCGYNCEESELPEAIKKLQDEMKMRKECIEQKSRSAVNKINKDIKKLQARKKEIHNSINTAKLSKLLTDENIDGFFRRIHSNVVGETDFKIEVRSHCVLMKYLLQNGHIDETYKTYMYFKTNYENGGYQ